MSFSNNPYKMLGIPENATIEQIKKAYREKAKQFHPDTAPTYVQEIWANSKMQEINRAYEYFKKHPPQILTQQFANPEEENIVSAERYPETKSYNQADTKDYVNRKKYSNFEKIFYGAWIILPAIPAIYSTTIQAAPETPFYMANVFLRAIIIFAYGAFLFPPLLLLIALESFLLYMLFIHLPLKLFKDGYQTKQNKSFLNRSVVLILLLLLIYPLIKIQDGFWSGTLLIVIPVIFSILGEISAMIICKFSSQNVKEETEKNLRD